MSGKFDPPPPPPPPPPTPSRMGRKKIKGIRKSNGKLEIILAPSYIT